MGPTRAEQAFMALSVVLTLALVGHLAYQAATAPAAAHPEARIEHVERLADGSLAVTVRLENSGGQGMRLVEVEVDCGAPPPSLTLDNIPAESHRVAVLVCPAGDPPTTARVVAWYSA